MQSFCFWSSQNQKLRERKKKSVQTKVMDSFDAHENPDLEIKERWTLKGRNVQTQPD